MIYCTPLQDENRRLSFYHPDENRDPDSINLPLVLFYEEGSSPPNKGKYKGIEYLTAGLY
jgi:hypothetical protein